MVHIDEIMIDNELDDFYRDRDRFKGHKLLIDFKQIDISFESSEIKMSTPKYKKKQKASKYIKPSRDKGSLF
jgi:hypothetical protein